MLISIKLLDRVEALENQTLPFGYVRAPAYDSGWITISQNEDLVLIHNLNTTDLFVYFIGKDSTGTHQYYYGGDRKVLPDWSTDNRGLYWGWGTNMTIQLYRLREDLHYEQVRVMIWRILEPPT